MVVEMDRRLRPQRRRSRNTFPTKQYAGEAGGKVHPPAFLRCWPLFRHRCGYNEEQ
jgi:hypothetical protein